MLGGLSVRVSTEVGLRTGLDFRIAKSAAWGWLWRSGRLVEIGAQAVFVGCQSSTCRRIRGQHRLARTFARVEAFATHTRHVGCCCRRTRVRPTPQDPLKAPKVASCPPPMKAARCPTRYGDCRQDAESHLDRRRSLDQAAARRIVGDRFLWKRAATLVRHHAVLLLQLIWWP